ncbi:diguanylate cyclase [Algiphilus sp.]|uniref:diguanylate cyclase domain-containing protein n=1 Tax=Algiphilus sp. TaxID=1872431 RepID=UPI0025BB1824|nr:diguanylate cyclase [Algiphilus sp.]
MQRAVRSATCRPLDRRPCLPRWRYRARPDTAPASGSCARPLSDFDGFKAVNDTRGHETGDLVLTQVAQRLQQSFDQQEGLKVAQTLINVIRQPVVTVYGSCQADACIGVASAQGPGRAGEACGRCDVPNKAGGGKNQAMLAETGPVAESAVQKVANG